MCFFDYFFILFSSFFTMTGKMKLKMCEASKLKWKYTYTSCIESMQFFVGPIPKPTTNRQIMKPDFGLFSKSSICKFNLFLHWWKYQSDLYSSRGCPKTDYPKPAVNLMKNLPKVPNITKALKLPKLPKMGSTKMPTMKGVKNTLTFKKKEKKPAE